MKPVIGLEVHVELKTKSKMFCGCSADYFGQKPNTHTCPVCLGLPGALPIPNKTAVEWCVILGMALNCNIPLFSKFDRKNYFYPDLSKGYQISQYDEPFCLAGNIKLNTGKTIGITRVHMEEDTGKLIHGNVDGEEVTLIDFNRSGVPLIEIVTEPDFDNAKDVVDYLKKLQQIVRYLEISNADMEKGDMRLEPNISLRIPGQTDLPNYKVEVKNINSFRFVEKAIDFEIKRQTEILEKKATPLQETRGWNEAKQKTVSQRVKEEASDYRYFPDPDIPPIRWSRDQLAELKKQIPELPIAKKGRFISEFQISEYDSEILTRAIESADYFEEAVRIGKDHNVSPKSLANYIINKKINLENTLPAELIKAIISTSSYATIDNDKISKVVGEVLAQSPQATNDYKAGKTQALQFLIGKTMSILKQKIDTRIIIEEINKQLK
ncbi:MAG: Asp-tRNA(Asn)/Glu-tRNA(Gln) amidotransferase subunit GatB [Patescibacteria group bacterium]